MYIYIYTCTHISPDRYGFRGDCKALFTTLSGGGQADLAKYNPGLRV